MEVEQKDIVDKKDAPISSKISSFKLELPWVEKYRPIILDDIVGNNLAITRLKVIAEEGNVPNMILSGPPGTGKTTSILCLAKQLLKDNYKESVLELNASDDRGIDVIRNKIKLFAQKKVFLPNNLHLVTLPNNRHKIILLDEADSMTPAAQQALRRIIELYSNTTRFALSCNTSSKIIEAIQSRCAILRFNKLQDQDILSRLGSIIQQEQINYTTDGLEALIFTCDGDMRLAINNLQSTYSGFGHISSVNVFKICDQPSPVVSTAILNNCIDKQLETALQYMMSLIHEGYSPIDIIQSLFKVIKTFDIDPSLKLNYIKEIGLTHLRISQGIDTHLQLNALLSRLIKIMDNHN